MAFLTEEELIKVGFQSIGKNSLISDKAVFYNPQLIKIGNNTRIDDFTILSAGQGGIEVGSYVHIACFCSLIGKGKIILQDFSGISSRVSIYSSNDDYSGEWLTNPMVDPKFTNVISKEVNIGRHVIIGSGSIVLPGVTIGEGSAVGALSLINKNCEEFKVYTGNPAKVLKSRSRNLLKFEKKLRQELNI